MTDHIIIPRPDERRATAPYKTPEQRWEEVTKQMYGSAELPETIRFDHDAEWKDRFWSIQNAYDQRMGNKIGFWSFIGMLFLLADVGGYTWMRWLSYR
jgi:hypothetical protein